MALVDCPECGREVSNRAPNCPDCAFPFEGPPKKGLFEQIVNSQRLRAAGSVGLRLFIGVMVAGVGGGEEGSGAAVFGGILIGASAFPTWYRYRLERFKNRRAQLSVDEEVERYVSDLRQKQDDEIARIEAAYDERVADLEERVDFAERLLTKGRARTNPEWNDPLAEVEQPRQATPV